MMITFNSSLLTIALIWIINVHQGSTKESYTDYYENSSQKCKEILSLKYNIDDEAGPENFKKSYKEMSVPEILYEFRKPDYEKVKYSKPRGQLIYINTKKILDLSKLIRLFKRELFINYFNDLLQSRKLLNLKEMKIPDIWCAEQILTVKELIKKTPYIEATTDSKLESICERFITRKMNIPNTVEKSYELPCFGAVRSVKHYVYSKDPGTVFDFLYWQWSNYNLNYKELIGVSPPDVDTDESKKNKFFIEHFSMAFYKYYEKAVDKHNYKNEKKGGVWSYKSVTEFCLTSAEPIFMYVQNDLLPKPDE